MKILQFLSGKKGAIASIIMTIVAYASVKSFNGLAVASIKNINNLA